MNTNKTSPKQQNVQKSITFNSLQEGEIFDTEMNRIMSIVNNVEREFG